VQAISFGATALFCLLSYYEHTRSVRPSFLLNVYLFLTLLFDIARCRTLWLRDPSAYGHTIAVLFSISVGSKTVLVLLEALEKTWILRPNYKDYPPEATASTYNRSFFWWLNSLFVKGFSSLLRLDQLFVVDKDMLSERVHAKMEEAWSKGLIFPRLWAGIMKITNTP
jgi:ATP-binding cassette subfamily C (CFTR/MRP) protein 1